MGELLDKIDSPQDLNDLSIDQLNSLTIEIREKIISTLSKNPAGGHIAPNLGIVEIALAVHHVFDSPNDKIIWDTSHQSYVHKILTGRRDRFDTIRQHGGIGGFTIRAESEHDTVSSGHASTSLSIACGLAEAKKMLKKEYHVVSITGDGALTGGLCYEAINNICYNHSDLIFVLNDNKMSIEPNVGAMGEYLNKLSMVSTGKRARRDVATIFENLGFTYFGPVNGNSIKDMVEVLEKAKTIKGPKLIHAITEKGKGCIHAENNKEMWHELKSPFDIETGLLENGGSKTYHHTVAETLTELGKTDDKIVAITAAMAGSTKLAKFAKEFPDRFYDVGIAEEHAITMSAGLALQGLKSCPVIHSSFLQRAFDQLIHDVALQQVPVKIFVTKSNITDDGPTQCGIFDLAYLRLIPTMVVMAPKDENELRHMIYTAVNYDKGPISVRAPQSEVLGVEMDKDFKEIPIGKGEVIKEGKDVTLLAIGSMVKEAEFAAQILERNSGIKATVINARFVKPLDEKLILDHAQKTGRVITIEEGIRLGGFGSAVLELFEKHNIRPKVKIIAAPDRFFDHGDNKIIKQEFGLCAENIANVAESLID